MRNQLTDFSDEQPIITPPIMVVVSRCALNSKAELHQELRQRILGLPGVTELEPAMKLIRMSHDYFAARQNGLRTGHRESQPRFEK